MIRRTVDKKLYNNKTYRKNHHMTLLMLMLSGSIIILALLGYNYINMTADDKDVLIRISPVSFVSGNSTDNSAGNSNDGTGNTPVDNSNVNTFSMIYESFEDIMTSGRYAYIENVESICQHPEYPTGCEVISLAVALRHRGYEVDIDDLIENHLVMGDFIGANPYLEFIGHPRYEGSYGCFASVIANCAKSFGAEAIDISHSGFNNILDYIDAGFPIVIWATNDLDETLYASSTWTDRYGNIINWPGREHCLVLVGYDTNSDLAYVCDPDYGEIRELSLTKLYERWIEQDRQAVLVY